MRYVIAAVIGLSLALLVSCNRQPADYGTSFTEVPIPSGEEVPGKGKVTRFLGPELGQPGDGIYGHYYDHSVRCPCLK